MLLNYNFKQVSKYHIRLCILDYLYLLPNFYIGTYTIFTRLLIYYSIINKSYEIYKG